MRSTSRSWRDPRGSRRHLVTGAVVVAHEVVKLQTDSVWRYVTTVEVLLASRKTRPDDLITVAVVVVGCWPLAARKRRTSERVAQQHLTVMTMEMTAARAMDAASPPDPGLAHEFGWQTKTECVRPDKRPRVTPRDVDDKKKLSLLRIYCRESIVNRRPSRRLSTGQRSALFRNILNIFFS